MFQGRLSALGTALCALYYALPSCGLALPVADSLEARQTTGYHWVDTWTSMPQLVESGNMPPSPFLQGNTVFKSTTLRQTMHMSIAASTIRIQLSNTFGGAALTITSAGLALPNGGAAGVNAIQPSTVRGLTFNGSESVTIPVGQVAYTDPIDFAVQAQQMITLTLYLANGQATASITGHPGSRTTTWMQQGGNNVNQTTVTGTSLQHWYYVSGVEAWAPANSSAFIILGDSITDGRGSDNDKNDRWPDLVLAKMQKNGLTQIGVDNQAAGGNRVLLFGLGPSLLTRYQRDAIQQQGVKYVMIFEGVNDIGEAGTDQNSQTQVGDQLIAAFTQIANDCRKAGLAIFAATITPFSAPGGASQQAYSDPTREKTRQRINAWFTSSGLFDAVVDFSKVVADPNTPSQLASKYNSGDYLHPNVAGYQAIADAFPLDIFTKFPATTT